jgi:hypothetical protein
MKRVHWELSAGKTRRKHWNCGRQSAFSKRRTTVRSWRIDMSATGLHVFDKTFQTTNIWLDEIMAKFGPDRQVAWAKVTFQVLNHHGNSAPDRKGTPSAA